MPFVFPYSVASMFKCTERDKLLKLIQQNQKSINFRSINVISKKMVSKLYGMYSKWTQCKISVEVL